MRTEARHAEFGDFGAAQVDGDAVLATRRLAHGQQFNCLPLPDQPAVARRSDSAFALPARSAHRHHGGARSGAPARGQPGADVRPGLLAPIEWLEYALAFLGGDSGAVVADLDVDAITAVRDVHPHRRRTMPLRVFEQVAQQAAQQARIAAHDRRVAIELHVRIARTFLGGSAVRSTFSTCSSLTASSRLAAALRR